MIGSKLGMLDIARAMATHATEAQRVAATNIAQADTPGYKARAAESFAEAYRAGRATPQVSIDKTAASDPNGNSVSLEAQVMALSQARGEHDLALGVWDQALSLYRTVLGRGR
ncbi:hypothetical protein [Parvularcula dongshanensis]|uniref:Flagellar basal-body rod protein FlgB n=1 Tax=Parvularcula dongshanensis TaxID=1173995 RepID=A0A840I5U3_9PROT|nr:hypothetical protein [Parvularcula dongshanensis]MBB4659641.1 flagellar basal-body rod protein FlgB [Parvularcula dongshanensis]